MHENAEQASNGSQSLLPLIELIYDAAGDASLWPVVLDRIAESVNCEQIALSASFSDPPVSNISNLARMAPKDLTAYTEYFMSAHILAERCDAPFPTGTVRYSPRALPHTEFDKFRMCSDCGLPHGMCCRFGLKVPLSDQPVASITCMRPRQRGHFNDVEGLVFKTLIPHLQRAFRLYMHGEQAKSNARELKSVLDTFDRAVFGLDRNGMVVLSNRHAEAIAEIADGLKLIRGRLVATSPSDNLELQSQIAKSAAAGAEVGTPQSVSLRLSRSSESLPLQLIITPFTSALPNHHGQIATLVFVSDPEQKPLPCSALLRQLYGLSPTECRLAGLLLQGLEVREAAGRLSTTLETARFHLKRVLAKTGARRQTELMRLMLSLPGVPSRTASVM